MAAPLVLQVGSRGRRTQAVRERAGARLARITYCEGADRWTGLPAGPGRAVHAALQARSLWLWSLDFKERVAYAGLVAAAELMRAGFAERVLILPLDWTLDPEAEDAGIGGRLPVGAALSFAVLAEPAPPAAGSAAWDFLDGPVVLAGDARAADEFSRAVEANARSQQPAGHFLVNAAMASVLAGRAGTFRQRLMISPDNVSAWRGATAAQVAGAFVRADGQAAPFVFNRLERHVAGFPWQRPEFSFVSGGDLRLGERLRAAFSAKSASDDPSRGSADPISGMEQHMLRQYLQQGAAHAGPGRVEEFVRWMLGADHGLAGSSRIEGEIYRHRPDLQAAFPERSKKRCRQLRQWFVGCGLSELGISLISRGDLDSGRAAPRSGGAPAYAVQVVGYLDSVLGLGTAARNLREALDLAGVSTVSTAVPLPTAQDAAPLPMPPMKCKVSVLVVNGDFLLEAMRHLDAETLAGSHRIGVWAWELPEVAPRMLRGLAFVDEIWAPSRFILEAFRAHTRKPIHVVPNPVCLDHSDIRTSDEQLPDEPYFLFAFDYNSAIERKNPAGLIEAFKSAFPDGCGPRLVIKTMNAGANPDAHERLLEATLRRKDIHLVDGVWSRGRFHRALRNCLGVVSLHRAEGFGFILAEAMAWGRPTIATGYSGNLEFQHEGNALLVGHRMTRVPAGCHHYPAGGAWAEPDLDAAAKAMRAVFKGGREIDALARAGAQTVRERLAPEVIGRQMKGLLLPHLDPGDGGATFIRQWRRLLGS